MALSEETTKALETVTGYINERSTETIKRLQVRLAEYQGRTDLNTLEILENITKARIEGIEWGVMIAGRAVMRVESLMGESK